MHIFIGLLSAVGGAFIRRHVQDGTLKEQLDAPPPPLPPKNAPPPPLPPKNAPPPPLPPKKDEKRQEGENKDECQTLYAIGDIHGDFFQAIRVLMATKLVIQNPETSGLYPEHYSWNHIAGHCMIQTGDLVGRGRYSLRVLQLFLHLEEASKGQLEILLGNHEIMVILGNYNFIPFRNPDPSLPPKERDQIPKKFVDEWNASLRERVILRFKTAVIKKDTVFVHAGFDPITLKFLMEKIYLAHSPQPQKLIDGINEYIRDVLLNDEGLWEFIYLNKSGQGSGVRNLLTQKDSDTQKKYRAVGVGEFIMFDNIQVYSPFFIQNYASEPSGKDKDHDKLRDVLEKLEVKRMVSGHCPTPYGFIDGRDSNRYIVIDTGMSMSGFPQKWEGVGKTVGKLSYLEIDNTKTRAFSIDTINNGLYKGVEFDIPEPGEGYNDNYYKKNPGGYWNNRRPVQIHEYENQVSNQNHELMDFPGRL